MPMSAEETRAYRRGYSAGSRWPDHRPPHPPHELSAQLIKASQELRDAVDDFLATIDKEDELQGRLGEPVDRLDAVLVRIGEWLKMPEDQIEPLRCCGQCGYRMTLVRPGKYQCDNIHCETKSFPEKADLDAKQAEEVT